MWEYETVVLNNLNIENVINAMAQKGWRLHSILPENENSWALAIFEREIVRQVEVALDPDEPHVMIDPQGLNKLMGSK